MNGSCMCQASLIKTSCKTFLCFSGSPGISFSFHAHDARDECVGAIFSDLFICMCEGFACMYVCTICLPRTHRGQKVALDSPELELQLVVSHYVGAGN